MTRDIYGRIVCRVVCDKRDMNLTMIRHTSVITEITSDFSDLPEPETEETSGTVSSVRLDSVVALCARLSRTKAAVYIEGEKVSLTFDNTTVVLPPAKAKKLIDGGYNGKTVVMGIRPEDIGDSQIEIEAHKDAVFETDVTGYELLGSEVLLYFNVAGTAMTAKVDSRTTARMGDHITLAIDPEKIHCFDKETELTITN